MGSPLRPGVVLMAATLLLCVASGCYGSTAAPSTAQCASAWNHGHLDSSLHISGQGQPTSSLGYLGRRVWLHGYTPSSDEQTYVACQIVFDLGEGRVFPVVSEALSPENAAAAARNGLVFHPIYGYAADNFDPLGEARLVYARVDSLPDPSGTPNACQGDDGTIEVSGCPPHDPSVGPLGVVQLRDQIDLATVRDLLAHGPSWWLGPAFRGFGPLPGGPGDGRRLTYQVDDGGHAWLVWVITVDDPAAATPSCAFLGAVGQPALCHHSTQVAQLLETAHPDPGHTVFVYSASWDVDHPRAPITPALASQIEAALRPIPGDCREYVAAPATCG